MGSLTFADTQARSNAEEGSRRLLVRQLQTGQHYLAPAARYAMLAELRA